MAKYSVKNVTPKVKMPTKAVPKTTVPKAQKYTGGLKAYMNASKMPKVNNNKPLLPY